MTVAFDTTIIGLLASVIGFILGRMRRRWYDNAMQRLDDEAIDILLVFTCGLIAALVELSPELEQHFQVDQQ